MSRYLVHKAYNMQYAFITHRNIKIKSNVKHSVKHSVKKRLMINQKKTCDLSEEKLKKINKDIFLL